MKRNLISATVIATLLAAPAAFAMERPEFINPESQPLVQKEVIAGSIFSTKELARRGLAADDIISVSVIPSGGSAVRLGRG